MTPKAIKQGTIPELTAAVALGTRSDQRKLLRAIRNINRSLVESRWTSDSTLDPETGVLVFRRQREAVIRLLALSPAVSEAGETAVRQLIVADRELARVAIDAALTKGKGINRAQLWFERGDTAYEGGDLWLAFRCYSMAWYHATQY